MLLPNSAFSNWMYLGFSSIGVDSGTSPRHQGPGDGVIDENGEIVAVAGGGGRGVGGRGGGGEGGGSAVSGGSGSGYHPSRPRGGYDHTKVGLGERPLGGRGGGVGGVGVGSGSRSGQGRYSPSLYSPGSPKRIYGETTFKEHCTKIPGLVNQQIEVCQKFPQKIFSISIGARTGILECHYQFRFERWNCTTNAGYESVFGRMLDKGTRETAFVYAVTSAGVVHAITMACSRGNLTDCSCDLSNMGVNTGEDWKWGGCSDNIKFGVDFAKRFVDAPEEMKHASNRNVRNLMNLHNNQVGRKAVADFMELKCRCHGVSGSCAVKTCWKTMPSFRRIGTIIKERYSDSVRVAPRSRKRLRRKEKKMRKVPIKSMDLVHTENSPNFCVRDERNGILGTRGRECNKTSTGAEGCQLLCCGRGYNTQVVEHVERCECRFVWCCEVKCKACVTRHDLHTCK